MYYNPHNCIFSLFLQDSSILSTLVHSWLSHSLHVLVNTQRLKASVLYLPPLPLVFLNIFETVHFIKTSHHIYHAHFPSFPLPSSHGRTHSTLRMNSTHPSNAEILDRRPDEKLVEKASQGATVGTSFVVQVVLLLLVSRYQGVGSKKKEEEYMIKYNIYFYVY